MNKWLFLFLFLLSCNSVKRIGTTVVVDGSKSNGTNNSPIIKYQWSCTGGCIFDNPTSVRTNVRLTNSKITLKITDSFGVISDATVTVIK